MDIARRVEKDIDALLSFKSRPSKARAAKLKAKKSFPGYRKSSAFPSTPETSSSKASSSSKSPRSSVDDEFGVVQEVDEIARAGSESPWGWRYLRQAHRDGLNHAIHGSNLVADLESTFEEIMSCIRYGLHEHYPGDMFDKIFKEKEERMVKGLQACQERFSGIRVESEVAIRWGRIIKPL
ncbi:hypothetical protein CC2G_002201 [Coprinopsis cinerea AmutBmut pab1-1]|nr:hypothetical protein CC2G_002201 [Coprinopsis cinerea AmutBmut pab1-1]